MEDAITQLIQLVRDASPILWNAAQQGVRARVITSIVWFVIFGLADIVYAVNFSKLLERSNSEDHDESGGAICLILFGGIIVVISVILAIVSIDSVINCILAPDYMAIKILTGLVIH